MFNKQEIRVINAMKAASRAKNPAFIELWKLVIERLYNAKN